MNAQQAIEKYRLSMTVESVKWTESPYTDMWRLSNSGDHKAHRAMTQKLIDFDHFIITLTAGRGQFARTLTTYWIQSKGQPQPTIEQVLLHMMLTQHFVDTHSRTAYPVKVQSHLRHIANTMDGIIHSPADRAELIAQAKE